MYRHLRGVLKAVISLASTFIRVPAIDNPISKTIQCNTKFFPYFGSARMAIDGTHLPVYIEQKHQAPFRSRKGLTQNVLLACDFDMMFTYVLSGWEGSISDSRLLQDAIERYNFPICENSYDLGDAGFALTRHTLVPYRGTRYHLKEWQIGKAR
jgi:hypothetical protein